MLPLLLTAWFLAGSFQVFATEQALDAARWEDDIRAFEAAARTNPPPKDATIFVGSSSIRLWTNLAEAFPGHPVVNRGFGGCFLSDCVAFARRIVVPFRPKLVLIYAGDNDLAAAKTPERILEDFRQFETIIKQSLPDSKIGFISIKPSPARENLLDKMRATNQLIEEYTRKKPSLLFIDVFTPLLSRDGKLRPELYQADQLHLNARGYQIWGERLRPVLDKFGS
jgi:lysophospholipase L1-like esterase